MSANFNNIAKVGINNSNQTIVIKQKVAVPHKASWISLPVMIAIRPNLSRYVNRPSIRIKSTEKKFNTRIEAISKEISLRLYSMDREIRNRARAALIFLNLNNQRSFGSLGVMIASAINTGVTVDKLIELIAQTKRGANILSIVRAYSQNC